MYTLDVPGVPVLLGIKTMDKMDALLNIRDRTLEFTAIFPGTKIPLIKGQNRHLLLDLCQDWNSHHFGNVYTSSSHNEISQDTTMQEKSHVPHRPGFPGADESQIAVDVIDAASEVPSEGSVIFVRDDLVMQTLTAQEAPPDSQEPSSEALTPSHEILQEDNELRSQPKGVRGNRQGDDSGNSGTKVEDHPELRQVRLGPCGVGKSSGRSLCESPMLGGSSDRPDGTWECKRNQRPRAVADMQSVHVEDGL